MINDQNLVSCNHLVTTFLSKSEYAKIKAIVHDFDTAARDNAESLQISNLNSELHLGIYNYKSKRIKHKISFLPDQNTT